MSEFLPNGRPKMNKTIIIAEAGVNHNGSMELAKRLVDVAADAGADYVKFQTFKSEGLVSTKAKLADYQKKNQNVDDGSQLEMLKKLELSYPEFLELRDYCGKRNVRFLSTAFDHESVRFLAGLDMDFFKIPSGEITNLPYLEEIARTKKRVIISTGMCSLSEVGDAVNVFKKLGYNNKDISLLHCNTEYPTPMVDVHLRAMNHLAKTFQVEVGYSDHTEGIEIPVAAVALGATIIEKHFTLDKSMPGPDHKASLSPDELHSMIRSIRNIEKALGKEDKKPSPSEIKNRDIARKSLVAKTAIKRGDVFTMDNLICKRPGNGISPMRIHEIIGKTAKKDFAPDELIEDA